MRKLPSENGLKKGPWTEEEDLKLIQYIQTHGPGKWRNLPKKAGLLRCGKSCRLRWTNYLRPDIKRGRFSFEEEETIIQLHSVLGNKWSTIATHLPGRTDNEIKNYWNTHIRKRLIQNGIDPVTHIPRVDFLKVSSILNSAPFNLSNLLNLQTLVNPQILTLAALLASTSPSPSHNENRESFVNKDTNSIKPNPGQQNPYLTSPFNLQSTQFLTQADDNQYFPGNLANLNGYSRDDILISTCLADNCFTIPNYSNQSTTQAPDQKANFESLYTKNIVPYKYDPVLSSPMSSPTPLISSLTFINSSGTEDERESYCDSMFNLDIQENFEFNDLM